ncbi:MAG: phage protease [Syntrophobacteraceae bacterium]|nr:phage protease [Syntrophobacteraceae bacterium]
MKENTDVPREKLTFAEALTGAGPPEGVPGEFQVFPSGRVEICGDEPFLVDDEALNRVIQRFESRGLDMVIDYEHQTEEGIRAPAAGWIKKLVNRGGLGLWAVVHWTEQAKKYLESREYRYYSPVFLVSKKDRRLDELLRVALTNAPRLNRIRPIVAKDDVLNGTNPNKEKVIMDLLKTLAGILGLGENAAPEEIVEAVRALVKRAQEETSPGETVSAKDLRRALDLDEGIGKSEIIATIHALRQRPDLTLEITTLRKQLAQRDRDALVHAALKAGKITPAQRSWAEEYAMSDPDGFKLFVAKAPQVVPIDPVAILPDSLSNGTGISDAAQLSINRMMGVGTDTWKKYGPQDGGKV